jgi:membrane associated rhomboid family serine protease
MIPLRDDNPTKRFPFVTVGIIGLCCLVYVYQFFLNANESMLKVYSFGFIPGVFFGHDSLPDDLTYLPSSFTLITSIFMHGGIMHLLGNMLYLWVFGDNIESFFGAFRFAIFYLFCGLVATFSHAIVDTESIIPLIGASGAISGVLGAYMVLYPRAKVLVAIPIFYFIYTTRLPAAVVLSIWFIIQLVSSILQDAGSGIAFLAHVGGFVSGLIVVFLIKLGGGKL